LLATLGEALDDAPGGRGRGHRAEQPGLVSERGQVAQAVPTIGQHDRQVGQHLAGPVPNPTWLLATHPAIQRCWQPETIGQLNQQHTPACPTSPSPSAVTSNPASGLVACTRKVPSLTGDRDLQQAAFSQLNEGTFSSPPRLLRALTKTPG